MAEQFHYHAGMDAFGQQESGGGVPPVMQPHVADAGRLQQIAPGVVVGLLVDGPSIELGEEVGPQCS